jgi:DNA-binding GntR family transcriptional regulator
MAPASRTAKIIQAPEFDERAGSLVGKIASQIAASIVDGALPPGADLNPVELAARFGTSRTPVREALMLLEKEGLVEIPPRRRPRVAKITFQEIQEIYQIRALLNGLMMELFVASADEAALAQSRAVYERMRAAGVAGEAELFFAERKRLHDLWTELCGNATLKRTLATWLSRLSLRRLGADRSEHIRRSLLDHERLMLAIDEGDAQLAAALLRSMSLMGLEAIRETGWSGAADEATAGAARRRRAGA